MTFRQTPELRRGLKINQVKMKGTILHYPVTHHGRRSLKGLDVLPWLHQGPREGGQHPLRNPAGMPPNWLESDLSTVSFCSQEVGFTSVSTGRLEDNSQSDITSQNKPHRAGSGTLLHRYLKSQLTVLYLFGARRIIKALKFNYNYGTLK